MSYKPFMRHWLNALYKPYKPNIHKPIRRSTALVFIFCFLVLFFLLFSYSCFLLIQQFLLVPRSY